MNNIGRPAWISNLKAQFESGSHLVSPSLEQQAARTQLLESVSAQVEQRFRQHQVVVYQQVLDALSKATALQNSAGQTIHPPAEDASQLVPNVVALRQ